MSPRSTLLRLALLLVFLTLIAAVPALAMLKETDAPFPPAPIYLSEIEACAPVQRLNEIRIQAEELAQGGGGEGDSAFMKRMFGVLFPFESPGSNALLATFYISSFPNLILAFIPPDLDLKNLNVMIGFATGGLLGDTFLNLIPHSFLGEPHPSGDVKIVVVEPKRNVLVGCAIFGGFALFFLLDKTMRYLSTLAEDGDEQPTGHSHGHSHGTPSSGKSSAVLEKDSNADGELRKRGGGAEGEVVVAAEEDVAGGGGGGGGVGKTTKAGAYLNLFADFTHNITDGLAMAASFYASPAIGATTTLACFAHEIPHEIADYSILIKSGFTKKQAMGSQFITAIGAFVGTFLGIFIQNLSASSSSDLLFDAPDLVAGMLTKSTGLLGTSLHASDLTIPIVAGSFLFIGAVTVVPELLADCKSGKQLIKEMLAMGVGICCMAWLSWNE